jgi:uncharacterized membrane protein
MFEVGSLVLEGAGVLWIASGGTRALMRWFRIVLRSPRIDSLNAIQADLAKSIAFGLGWVVAGAALSLGHGPSEERLLRLLVFAAFWAVYAWTVPGDPQSGSKTESRSGAGSRSAL